MEDVENVSRRRKKFLLLLLKLLLTGLCIWYVSGKIDVAEAGLALRRAKPGWLVIAFLAFILSKCFAALRLNIYFRDIGIRLTEIANIRLYLMGMFYNLFLPGSVSGDAYKVILLGKRYQVAYKKGAAAVLIDRVSGVLGLGILLCFFSLYVLPDPMYRFIPAAATIAGIAGLYLLTRFFFRDFLQSYVPTLLAALLVQGSQVVCAWCILKALGIDTYENVYLFLFLLSSIVSVLPLTIGGLGARELVFLEGARYFGLEQEPAVMVSLIFYLITLLTSAAGIVYVFRDPLGPGALKKDP